MRGQRSPEQFKTELETEVAKLRELSITSTDPLIVAEAIAASDGTVQQQILARLSDGQRLVEVFSFGLRKTEIQVFFRFVPTDGPVHLVDNGILVFVDYAKGQFLGMVDPYFLQ